MKQPRIADFDPNAQEKTLKSSMDDFPTIQKPPTNLQQKKELASENNMVPRYHESRGTTVPAIGRKIKRRHPFDIFEDQLDSLRKLSIEEITNGGVGSMSAMIREAIDDFLAKRLKK